MLLAITVIIASLAALATLLVLPWVCQRLMQSMIDHWRNAPPGAAAYNPLQEFVQPQNRHVIEVQDQRQFEVADGAPPGSGKTTADPSEKS